MGPWYYEVVSFDGDYVNLRRTDIASDELNPVALALLPPEIEVGGARYELSYHFAPGAADDGVTLTLPLAHLNRLSPEACEWLVPGLLRDKVLQLLKQLPQRYRSKLVPLPAFAAAETVAMSGG